jgi:tRNA 2-thiouridine synthesizing protein D
MIFSLLVQSSPVAHPASRSAYLFARAAVDAGHTLFRVFFIGDGALHGTALAQPAGNEANLTELWRQLAAAHGADLVLCITSALRRGVLDSNEAVRRELPSSNLYEGFAIAGLGQLVEATLRSDRVVSFGG